MKYYVISEYHDTSFQNMINEAYKNGYTILECGVKGTSGGYWWAIMQKEDGVADEV